MMSKPDSTLDKNIIGPLLALRCLHWFIDDTFPICVWKLFTMHALLILSYQPHYLCCATNRFYCFQLKKKKNTWNKWNNSSYSCIFFKSRPLQLFDQQSLENSQEHPGFLSVGWSTDWVHKKNSEWGPHAFMPLLCAVESWWRSVSGRVSGGGTSSSNTPGDWFPQWRQNMWCAHPLFLLDTKVWLCDLWDTCGRDFWFIGSHIADCTSVSVDSMCTAAATPTPTHTQPSSTTTIYSYKFMYSVSQNYKDFFFNY